MAASGVPSDKQPGFPSWVKNFWALIAGIAGAITLIVQFLQLWRGDQATVTLVTAILGALLVLAGLIWVGFSFNRFSEMRDFPELGKTTRIISWRYPKRLRHLAFAGLIIYFVAVAAGGYLLFQQRQKLVEKTIILIATLDGPENTYGVTNELLEQLDNAIADYQDIKVLRFGETITVEQGSGYARKAGERYLADIVVWGWYRPTENPNLTIHVENLVPAQNTVIQSSAEVRLVAALADMQSFTLQQKLGEEMSAMVLFISGLAHYTAQDYSGALLRFEAALASDELEQGLIYRFDILFYAAFSHIEMGQQLDAKNYFAQLIQTKPDSARNYQKRSFGYFYLGQYEEAIADATEAIELEPKNAYNYYYRGLTYDLLFKPDKALADYTEAINHDPQNAFYYSARGYGVYVLQFQEYEKGIADLTKAIELEPKNADYYVERGTSYMFYNKYEEAIKDHSKPIQLYPNEASHYSERSDVYRFFSKYEEAIRDKTRAIHLDPTNASYYSDRAILYRAITEYDNAVADFSMSIKLDPTNAYYYSMRGNVKCFYLDKCQQAISDYTQAIQLRLENASYYSDRGSAYARLGKAEEAISDYTQAILMNPDDGSFYFGRAEVYAHSGHYKEALIDYSRTLEIWQDLPSIGHIFRRRADVYSQLNDYTNAAADYSQAIELDPLDYLSYCGRGHSYKQINEVELALADLQMCVENIANYDVKLSAEKELLELNATP